MFWRTFWMDGMHEAKKNEFKWPITILHVHAKTGESCQKQGSFHSFGNMQNESMSQLAWSCEILAWLYETNKDSCKNFNPLDHFAWPCEHFAWLCEIQLKHYSKMNPLDHFAHLCENFACLCQNYFFFLKKKKQICLQYKPCFISHR